MQAVGRTVTLLLPPSGSMVALGPAWATLCGACAARAWQWDGATMLSLVATVFVTEVLWASWRAHLVEADWKGYLAAHPLPPHGDQLPALPYTTPASPLGHLLKRWGQVRRWVRESLTTSQQGAILALPVLPALALLLSALVSWHLLVLSLAALCLSLLEWRLAQRATLLSAPQAALEIGLSWLAGHVAFAPLTSASFILACCYAVAYQGTLVYQRQPVEKRHRATNWALGALYFGQVAALVLVLARGRPGAALAATAMGLLTAPQLLLLAHPEAGEPAPRRRQYLVRAVPFLALAMPIAAWMA